MRCISNDFQKFFSGCDGKKGEHKRCVACVQRESEKKSSPLKEKKSVYGIFIISFSIPLIKDLLITKVF